jgi:uncharacterized protein
MRQLLRKLRLCTGLSGFRSKIVWATDYPDQDGFFPGAPQMVRDRLRPLSTKARHPALAGCAVGFYGIS